VKENFIKKLQIFLLLL